MFQEFNIDKSKKILKKPEKMSRKEEVDLGKRKLLISAGLFATAGIMLGVDKKINIAKTLGELIEKWRKKRENGQVKIQNKNELGDKEEKKTEIIPANTEDCSSIGGLIDFDSAEKVKLGKEEILKLKNYWKKSYAKGQMKPSLEAALFRAKDWEAPAKREFYLAGLKFIAKQKEMSPEEKKIFWEKFEECFYLVIPESHWKLDSHSGKGAAGPFQIMPKTADKYGLARKYNYDERYDPLKSARVAAECLLDLYHKMNNDWDLAVSGYNGGIVWKFKKEMVQKKQPINYANYLKYLEANINEAKNNFSYGQKIFHLASSGDSWELLAKKYNTTKEILLRINDRRKGVEIKANEHIIVPATKENRKKAFYTLIDGFAQNINYPAKLYAVLDVLKEEKYAINRNFSERENFLDWRSVSIEQVELFFIHKVAKGESLSFLARKNGISLGELLAKNGFDDEKNAKLKPGQKIWIRYKDRKPLNLLSVAKKYGCDFKELIKLNPAIKNSDDALPGGKTIVRIPFKKSKEFLVKREFRKSDF